MEMRGVLGEPGGSASLGARLPELDVASDPQAIFLFLNVV